MGKHANWKSFTPIFATDFLESCWIKFSIVSPKLVNSTALRMPDATVSLSSRGENSKKKLLEDNEKAHILSTNNNYTKNCTNGSTPLLQLTNNLSTVVTRNREVQRKAILRQVGTSYTTKYAYTPHQVPTNSLILTASLLNLWRAFW